MPGGALSFVCYLVRKTGVAGVAGVRDVGAAGAVLSAVTREGDEATPSPRIPPERCVPLGASWVGPRSRRACGASRARGARGALSRFRVPVRVVAGRRGEHRALSAAAPARSCGPSRGLQFGLWAKLPYATLSADSAKCRFHM